MLDAAKPRVCLVVNTDGPDWPLFAILVRLPHQKLIDLLSSRPRQEAQETHHEVGGAAQDFDPLSMVVAAAAIASGRDVCYSCAVPCEVAQRIEQVIASDRRTIFTFCAIYPAVFICSVLVSLYFHYFLVKGDPLLTLAGAPISLIAAPLVLQHIRRVESLRMLKIYRKDCDQHPPADPACGKIADNVDAMIKERAGIK
jgi:hypothetical protein